MFQRLFVPRVDTAVWEQPSPAANHFRADVKHLTAPQLHVCTTTAAAQRINTEQRFSFKDNDLCVNIDLVLVSVVCENTLELEPDVTMYRIDRDTHRIVRFLPVHTPSDNVSIFFTWK